LGKKAHFFPGPWKIRLGEPLKRLFEWKALKGPQIINLTFFFPLPICEPSEKPKRIINWERNALNLN